jgi:hypothetical protein
MVVLINVVDIISIIPQSTNHLIGTCYSINDVVSAIAVAQGKMFSSVDWETII